MSVLTKLVAIGNSSGFIVPKETLAHLKAEKGDMFCITEAPFGINVTPYDEQFVKKLESAERVMRKYRDALRKLAE